LGLNNYLFKLTAKTYTEQTLIPRSWSDCMLPENLSDRRTGVVHRERSPWLCPWQAGMEATADWRSRLLCRW